MKLASIGVTFHEGLIKQKYKVIDYFYETAVICDTCTTLPEQYIQGTEVICSECKSRVVFN